MTAPKCSQTLANFSGSLSASLPSSCTMRLVTPLRIAANTSLFWISLARHVERQVGAVDDEADEAQPAGQDVGVLGDQHAAHIELVAALPRGIEQVERPRARNEGEHGVFVPALGAPMEGQRRLVELAGEAAVELGVVLGRDLGFGLRPDRRAVREAFGLGARLLDEVDRHGDRARMVADDPLDPPRVENSCDSALRWRMTRVPRAGASSSASGAMVNAPLPSDDQRQASSRPARRVSTTTSSATMKAE